MLDRGILPGVLLTVLFFGVIACMGVIYNYPRKPQAVTLLERAKTALVSVRHC